MVNRHIEATTQIVKGHGFLTDAFISSSSNDGHVIIYDGTNTNGEVLVNIYVGTNYSADFSPRTWPKYNVGLYAVVSGTNPKVNIGYRTDD